MNTSSAEWLQICEARWVLVHHVTNDARKAWLERMKKKRGKEWMDKFRKVMYAQYLCRQEWMHETNEFYRELKNGS